MTATTLATGNPGTMIDRKTARRAGLPQVLLAVLFVLGFAPPAQADRVQDAPITLAQPDGQVLHLRVTGDEFHRTVQDADGYTVVEDPGSGYLVYADRVEGKLVPTHLVVGTADPATLGLLAPGLADSPAVVRARIDDIVQASPAMKNRGVPKASAVPSLGGPKPAPKTGNLANLMIFVRFSDQSEFGEPISTYEQTFNTNADGLRSYYQEASYESLAVTTSFFPAASGGNVVSFQDSHARGYFLPYNASTNPAGYPTSTERSAREVALLSAAIQGVAAGVPPSLTLDGDGDGFIDNVVFVVRGGDAPWAELLWPHMSDMTSANQAINGKKVGLYNLMIADHGESPPAAGISISTCAHELAHTIGLPDLYHYVDDGVSPVGPWDLMENNLSPPQHMSSYMKWKYTGWIASIPEITTSGTYQLSPLASSSNNAFRIRSPHSTKEYFVVEYRRKAGSFESSLYKAGLIIYRVDTRQDGNGNADGPPDELFAFRPSDGGVNGNVWDLPLPHWWNGDNAFTEATDPAPTLRDGSAGGIRIRNVTAAGNATISFSVCVDVPVCGSGATCGDDTCGKCRCDDANPCTTDTCSAGSCQFGCAADGSSLPVDYLPCTQDSCQGCARPQDAGTCAIGDACHVQGDVDPENPCQECRTASSTRAWTADDTNSCQDGSECTVGDACQAGACVAGATETCNDGLACTLDSCEPAGTRFDTAGTPFADISATGIDTFAYYLTIRGPFPFGFDFPHFDATSQPQFWVNTFGQVQFAGGSSLYLPACPMPGGSGNKGYIAALWENMRCDPYDAAWTPSCSIKYQAFGTSPNRYVIVQWTNVRQRTPALPSGNPATSLTFQIVLFENGAIEFRYKTLTGLDGSTSAVGIESIDGTRAVPYSCKTAGLVGGLSLRYPGGYECDHEVAPDTCLIDGVCRAAGEPNPANPCQECVPGTNPTSWTNDNGNACSDGSACTRTDSCQAGACVGGNPVVCTATDQCHEAGTCDVATGVCSNPAKADGTACSDGNACSQTDTCVAGVCNGANPVVCAAPDQCHAAGTCDVATGVCSNPAKADGTACNDSNACSQTDTCVAGICIGANPVVCAAPDQCHAAGTCDVATGVCSNPAKANGTACNDGNACSQTDTCQTGICVGANPVVCATPDQCHVAGTCNVATGVCSNPAKANGTACNDGNACSQTDTCQTGICVGANPVVCATPDQCHVAGTCNVATGVCSNPAKANGTVCNDGNACSQTDTCQTGICVGANPVVCTAIDQCHEVGTCNSFTGMCSNPMKADGAACNDGNACSRTDACQAGACVGADPVVCAAPDQCHLAGTCNASTGVCSNPVKANGSACSDGDACSQTDTCQAGACIGANPLVCGALDQCHLAGTCDSVTGQCTNPARTDGEECDDGNACSQADACQAGACVGANPVVCAAPDQCHDAGTCDEATGVCSNPPKANGSACIDGDACSQSDTCQAGTCVGADPVVCGAQDQCHLAGTCDAATGLCSNPPRENGAECSDGDRCSQGDTCQAGACEEGARVVCTATDQCHEAGTCDAATGQCSNPARADGADCNDGDACSQTDTCQAGTCVGANPVVCGAADQCHDAGTCDEVTGVCSNPQKVNGAACDDGDACSRVDTCQAGTCVGADPVVCAAPDPCHLAGTCNPGTGVCSNPPKPNGVECSDGDACSLSDTCQEGACVGANPVVCVATDTCHVAGTCDTATGVCSNPPKANGAECSDGDACSLSDTCQEGACVGANPVVCVAVDPCHVVGTCDEDTGLCSRPQAPDGTECDDGSACTREDTCLAGTCVGADPILCAAPDSCHDAGTCDVGTGVCTPSQKADGADCDDGNLCTKVDACQSGACIGGNLVVCVPSDSCHDAGTCDAGTGVCTNPRKADGTACNDDDLCTLADTCQAGACVGADPVVCAAPDSCHDAGTCDAGTGVCTTPPKADGAVCSDDDLCTLSDTCQAGTCVGGNPVVCAAVDSCHDAGTCDAGTGECTAPRKADGAVCSDDDLCTTADTCQAGTCVGGNPVVCTALDSCHDAGVCDSGTGTCTTPPKADGTACSDGDLCTLADACQAGTCVGGAPRDCAFLDGPCVEGLCNGAAGGCVARFLPDDTGCDDLEACTSGDACREGICEPGPDLVCDCATAEDCPYDGNLCNGSDWRCNQQNRCELVDEPVICTVPVDPCLANACNPVSGVCVVLPGADGAACTDDSVCTTGDACQAGVCTGVETVTCNDDNPCTDDACQPDTGCSYVWNSTPCDDGLACTRTDACREGVCQGTDAVTCLPPDACNGAGQCDEPAGTCSRVTLDDGTACDDGDSRTTGDRCTAGECSGDPCPCAVVDACCDGCQARNEGGECALANRCVHDTACGAGMCLGQPVQCPDPMPCHVSTGCDPVTGQCGEEALEPGTACDDGNDCTQDDQCDDQGACLGSPVQGCGGDAESDGDVPGDVLEPEIPGDAQTSDDVPTGDRREEDEGGDDVNPRDSDPVDPGLTDPDATDPDTTEPGPDVARDLVSPDPDPLDAAVPPDPAPVEDPGMIVDRLGPDEPDLATGFDDAPPLDPGLADATPGPDPAGTPRGTSGCSASPGAAQPASGAAAVFLFLALLAASIRPRRRAR